MNKRQLGDDKEKFAEEYLIRSGYRILERNFRCRTGEIDRIASCDGYLVFVEVRYRGRGGSALAKESINIAKQQRICRTADFYRSLHSVSLDTPIRFDVVAVSDDDIQLIQNAFPYCAGSGKYSRW